MKILNNRLLMIASQIGKQFSTQKKINNIDILSNGQFAKVILNKPKALNSLSSEMVKDLTSQRQFLSTHKAFWMEGAGGKAFCAGGDVKALFVDGATKQDRVNFFKGQFQLDYSLTHLNSLQIANWDGIVMGGGVGISAFAPYIIATQNSMYAMPEGKIGFFTDVGSGYFLSRLRNNIGFYLGMTGARLKGEEVFLAGLANFYIPRENVQKAYEEINSNIGSAGNVKEFLNQTLSKYHQAPKRKEIQNQGLINEIFSKKSVKQIYNFVKSNDNAFHKKVLKNLQEQCPLSVHVIQKSIQLSKNRSIKECFEQDFVLCQHFSVNQNFSEGVRCLLIDKGDTPKFTHKHLSQVSTEEVEKLFKPDQGFESLGI